MQMGSPTAFRPVASFSTIDGAASLASEGAAEQHDVRLAGVRTFFINRDCDDARRVSIENGLQEAGLRGERIRAVEGLAVPAQFRSYFFEGDKLHSKLKPGEVGCYASHLLTMERIVAQNVAYALILEDDAVLPNGFADIIENLLETLPQDWDIVHLCKDPSRAVRPIAELRHGGKLVRYSRIPETTTGYLVSLRGAKKFLKPVKRYWPVDTDFRQPWRFGLEIYGVVPQVVRALDTFPSSIHALGDHSRLRRGLPWPSRHCWTGNPLHTPQGVYFNIKTLGPISWLVCASQNAVRRLAAIGLKSYYRGRAKTERAASNLI